MAPSIVHKLAVNSQPSTILMVSEVGVQSGSGAKARALPSMHLKHMRLVTVFLNACMEVLLRTSHDAVTGGNHLEPPVQHDAFR